MTLIKSISGIRGTIGKSAGDNLTPLDIVKFTAAYATQLKNQSAGKTVIIGRDGRNSGPMVSRLVAGTLQGMGLNVIDAGLTTTPTMEMAIIWEKAAGGIIITASHNPGQWNALKLLDEKGEFISADAGQEVLKLAESPDLRFAEAQQVGSYTEKEGLLEQHIEAILDLPLVGQEAIRAANFKVAVDGINSSGGIAIPILLKQLGVEDVIEINCEVTGKFAHNPEPLAENLAEIAKVVDQNDADVGIVVDPDVDRLAFINEDGTMFGEEYTLVAVADYILQNKKGNTVSNLSSTKALKEITEKHGGEYYPSAVGEVNVVEKMKAVNAVIGGEGNGGIIYPELHYGRDALMGIALFLTHLAKFGKSCSRLRSKYPNYHISKNKIQLETGTNLDKVFEGIKQKYANKPTDETDGLKITFDDDWVHLRMSNTEPIIRIYAESDSENTSDNLSAKITDDIREVMKEMG